MTRTIPLIIFIALAALLFASLGKDHSPKSPWEGRRLPALSATKLGEKAPSPIAPNGVTLINLFASWCTPCLVEHPQLKALVQEHDVRIIGIAWNDTPDAVRAFLKTHGNPYREVYLDSTGDNAIALGLRGVPESYLVGADGRILYHLAGPLTAQVVEKELLPLLETSRVP